tara:strand:- start:27 stop:1070 length:1044 start_codon:yes stop_codon:yes gene_type:complete
MKSTNLPDYTIPANKVPLVEPKRVEKSDLEILKRRIIANLKKINGALIAHYYVDGDIQDLAEESGGFVSDSLEMARYGSRSKADVLVVAGVRFMGETAKILSPEKRVIMPKLEAECSLDLGCPPDDFQDFIDQNPDRTVVVYANTSARVKAMSDWVVTSSCALPIVNRLKDQGEKILWAPDRHLGSYIQQQTSADMLMWSGACVVHEEFKSKALLDLKKVFPEAAVLAHPESPASVVQIADVVGSTSAIIRGAKELENEQFIVATDRGIFHKLRQLNPGKRFIEAPTAGNGATCRSCAHCPWMAMNDLIGLDALVSQESAMKNHEVHVDQDIAARASIALQRMLDFQ